MNHPKILSDRFREVMLNGTWIANTNFKDQLSQVSCRQATSKVGELNTIANLTFHINYYIAGVLQVLNGGSLDIRDKFSFDCPSISTAEEWETMKNDLYKNADLFAAAVEVLPGEKLDEGFIDEKYGTYLRNIEGMIEHCYYHLGQVVLIRKMIGTLS